MHHPVLATLSQIRTRAKRLLLLFAVSLLVIGLLGASIAFGVVDYLVRVQDPGLRWMFSLLVLGVTIAIVVRYLWPAMRIPLSDLEIARRIEQCFPPLRNRLSSAVEFLTQSEDDPYAGSPQLRRAVIQDASAQLHHLDPQAVLEIRQLRWIGGTAAGILILALFLLLLAPGNVSIAAGRLMAPWGGPEWPKRHELALIEPQARIARGQNYEIRIRDQKGQLPSELQIEFRSSKQEQPEVQRLKVQGSEEIITRKESVSNAFEFRVLGGDDRSMAWFAVDVVDPPTVSELEVNVYPPSYTGIAPYRSPAHVRAIKGSRVVMRGKSSKPLDAARLQFQSQSTLTGDLLGSAREFQVEFTAQATDTFWFELQDQEGFEGAADQRYELTVLSDAPPSVVLEEPSVNTAVSARAIVPLGVVARDDLALRNVRLHYKIVPAGQQEESANAEELQQVLFAGPATPPEIDDDHRFSGEGQREEIRQDWDLSRLETALEPGVEIVLYATATDYQPATGKSEPKRLAILTDQQLLDRINGRQSQVLNELGRLTKLQQEARQQTQNLEIVMEEVGSLSEEQADTLQAAEITQRQVQKGLADEEGIVATIDEMLSELRNNRLDAGESVERLNRLKSSVQELGQNELPKVSHELTTALKATQNQPTDFKANQEIAENLQSARKGQDEVVRELDALLQELSRWDDARRFRQELREFQEKQEELAEGTLEQLKETLTRDLKDLSPQQVAKLKQLTRQQQELSEDLARWMSRAEQSSRELQEADPKAAQSLSDANALARELALHGRMRAAAQDLQQNRVGQTAEQQQQIADSLQEVLDELSNRPPSDTKQLVRKLREAEEKLKRLRREQKELQRELQANQRNPNAEQKERELQRLMRKQENLEQELARFSRQLQRLTAKKSSQSVRNAEQKVDQAGKQAQAGKSDLAEQQAQQAEKDLEQAQQQLAERRREAEADLAYEKLTKMKDELVGVHDRQKSLLEGTERLEDLRQQNSGELTPGQRASLQQLAANQALLEEQTFDLAEKLAEAVVFRMALDGARGEMQAAADMLSQGQTGSGVQTAEANALRRMEQLLEALNPDPPDDNQEQAQPPGGGGGENQQQNRPQDGIPDIAQLKMLKLLQQEINQRTQALESKYGLENELSEAQENEYQRLAAEQGRLANLLRQLMPTPTEGQPEELPLE